MPFRNSKYKIPVMEFIERFMARNGCAPSVREILRGVPVSSLDRVYAALRVLEQEGYIKVVPYEPRGIRLTRKRLEPDM